MRARKTCSAASSSTAEIFAAAIRDLQASVALAEDFETSYILGVAYLQAKRFADGQKWFQRVQETMGESAALYVLIGRALLDRAFSGIRSCRISQSHSARSKIFRALTLCSATPSSNSAAKKPIRKRAWNSNENSRLNLGMTRLQLSFEFQARLRIGFFARGIRGWRSRAERERAIFWIELNGFGEIRQLRIPENARSSRRVQSIHTMQRTLP